LTIKEGWEKNKTRVNSLLGIPQYPQIQNLMKKPCRLFLAILLFLLLHTLPSHAASRYWVSVLGGNWNSANWASTSGGLPLASVPGAGDDVFFDGGGLGLDVGNCTINATVSVASLTISAGYTGTISQGANPITVSGAASFGGGKFTGGTAAITITGVFTLSATTFTSTSGILQLQNNAAFTGGSFAHNNGEVQFDAAGAATVSGTSPTFYTLEFDGNGNTYTISTGAVPVVNALNLAGTGSLQLNAGVFNLTGNLNLTNTATTDGGTATINFTGGGAQAIVSALPINESTLPSVGINKAGGVLTMPAWLTVAGNWTFTAGTVDVTTNGNTLVFAGTAATITGSQTLNNVNFEGNSANTLSFAAGTVYTVTGTLTTSGTAPVLLNTTIAGATALQAQGNIVLNNTGTSGGGTGLLLINGTGAQSLSGNAASGQGLLPYITIQKASGTLTMTGTISVSQNWTYASGTVAAGSSTVVAGGNNLTITSAGMSFYNLTLTANTATLGSNLTVSNNLTISGTGILAAGAQAINIGGNWNDYSQAGFTEATSTVNFNGSGLQTITTPGGEDFSSLTVNNSGTGIQLINNAIAETGISMTQGNIDLDGNTLTLGTAIGTPGTLTYTAGNIINTGSFTRWFPTAAISGAAGLFPMGTAINTRPLSIVSTVSPTLGGTITVSYTDAGSTTPVSFLDGGTTVLVRKDLNWAITPGGGLSGGTYSLTAAGTGLGTIGNISDLRLTLATSATGTAGVNGGTIADPQVTTTGLSLANLSNSFYITSVNAANSPLPVKLLSFTAVGEGGSVVLDWTIATETDNAVFDIQRSKDAVGWESIGQVAAVGTTDLSDSYSAVDRHPYTGTSYYRLLQTDPDGSQSYSGVRAVNLSGPASLISIYPNPAANRATVSFSVAGQYEIALFNSGGQQVIPPVSSSGETVSLAVSSLPAGVYFIRIKSAGPTETRAVVIGKAL
jgi:hypothetical protein